MQLSGNQPPPASTPWVESAAFEEELSGRSGRLTDELIVLATELHRDGFAVLRRAVPTDLCDRVRAEVEPLFESEYAKTERRVPDAWRQGAPSVRELALLPRIQEILATLYGRRPIPFQTLNFKWGTQQGYHSDAVHFSSMPSRYMCGVWVALEDVDETNGPLSYYPGSHRVPQFASFAPGTSPDRYAQFEETQRRLMDDLGVKPLEFHASKGDLLFWTSSVLHGGKPIQREGSTRWSQVTHFFFEDCVYFQPIYSDAFTGEIKLMDIVDLNTLDPVPHRYEGHDVVVEPLPNGRSRIAIVDADGTVRAGSVSRTGELEAELRAVRADRDALRRSRSYRLGNALVAPLSRLRPVRPSGSPAPAEATSD